MGHVYAQNVFRTRLEGDFILAGCVLEKAGPAFGGYGLGNRGEAVFVLGVRGEIGVLAGGRSGDDASGDVGAWGERSEV